MSKSRSKRGLIPDLMVVEHFPPMACEECGGSGRIALLVTAGPCTACKGTGSVQRRRVLKLQLPQFGRGRVDDLTFDSEGRLTRVTHGFEPCHQIADSAARGAAESDHA